MPETSDISNPAKPYDERPWDDPLCLLALEHCPWRDTDHDRGIGPRRENYCTWCEGYVTALINHSPFILNTLETT